MSEIDIKVMAALAATISEAIKQFGNDLIWCAVVISIGMIFRSKL